MLSKEIKKNKFPNYLDLIIVCLDQSISDVNDHISGGFLMLLKGQKAMPLEPHILILIRNKHTCDNNSSRYSCK